MKPNKKIIAFVLTLTCLAFVGYSLITYASTQQQEEDEENTNAIYLASCWFDFQFRTSGLVKEKYDPNYIPTKSCLELMTTPIITGDKESDEKYKEAADRIEQYFIVRKLGSQLERCLHAGRVANSYLQIPDEDKYDDWKHIQSKDCL